MIAVLFEAQVTPAQQERYLALAAQLKPLLETIDGFIAIERFAGKDFVAVVVAGRTGGCSLEAQYLSSGGAAGRAGVYLC